MPITMRATLSQTATISPPTHPVKEFFSNNIKKIVELFKKIMAPLAGYLLKISFFQTVPRTDCFSRWVMGPLARCVLNIWQKTQGIQKTRTAFDPARLEKSRVFLSKFGDWKTTRAADGIEVKWGMFRAERFNQWVDENGGVREGEWIRPRTEADWPRLQKLREFKWFEEVGHAFKVPPPIPGAENICVLRCPGFGRSMPMDKAFIGLHLAAGFNFAIPEWRENFLEGGFFHDAEAVYQEVLKEGFAPQRIKTTAHCRSTFAASRLKELHHAEGLDAILIHPPSSLSDVVANQKWPANKIGLLGVPEIEKNGIDFNTIQRIRNLPPGPGRLCIIISEGDKTLPKDTAKKFEEAAQHANCQYRLILEKHKEGGSDPHFGEPLKNPEILMPYLSFLGGN